MIDCPEIVDLNVEWWTGMGAVTLDSSDLSEELQYTADIPSWFNGPQGDKVELQGKTVHTILHISEPEGSVYQKRPRNHMCLSRTRLDGTPPTISPLARTFFTCVSCKQGALHNTTRGPMLYTPSRSQLSVAITSFDDASSNVAFGAIQLFVADAGFPHLVDNTACARYAELSRMGSHLAGNDLAGRMPDNPLLLERGHVELDKFLIDLSSGVATWSPQELTSTREGWEQPAAGGWLGASAWNPKLTAAQQSQHPLPKCSTTMGSNNTYTTEFTLTDAQAACGLLDITISMHALSIASVLVNGVDLLTPSLTSALSPTSPSAPPPPPPRTEYFISSGTSSWTNRRSTCSSMC